MPFSATLFEELEKLDSSTRGVLIKVLKEIEFNIGELVTRKDFNELKEEVKKLTNTVQELAEAQKITEQRVNELAEAQKKTEQRLNELAEAQKKTEQKLNELAEAQKKTEQAILELTSGLKETRQQLGGLSDTVGYTVENEAYKALPALLKRDYGLEIEGRLKRGYLRDSKGRYIEVNILGKGRVNGKEVTIIGESKVRLSKKAVREFIELRLKNFESLYGEIFPVVVTHMISEPDVEDFAREKGIALYYSYDF